MRFIIAFSWFSLIGNWINEIKTRPLKWNYFFLFDNSVIFFINCRSLKIFSYQPRPNQFIFMNFHSTRPVTYLWWQEPAGLSSSSEIDELLGHLTECGRCWPEVLLRFARYPDMPDSVDRRTRTRRMTRKWLSLREQYAELYSTMTRNTRTWWTRCEWIVFPSLHLKRKEKCIEIFIINEFTESNLSTFKLWGN